MRKLVILLLAVSLLAPLASAQYLIGGRASGMGGAGVASTNDLAAAYYNPACLMRSEVKVADLKVAAGAAYTDLTKLTNAFSKSSDPAQFLLDNYAENLNFSGNLSGVIGLNIRKIGISVVPIIGVTSVKPANSLAGSVEALGYYAPTLTLGHTFAIGFLPAALDVGVNLKMITPVKGSINATLDPLDPNKSSGAQIYGTGSGFGCDIGALTTFDVPLVSKLAVGASIRDIAASYTIKPTSRTAYINKTTGQVTLGAESILADQTTTIDPSYALGAYATVPGINLGIAADIEMTKTDTNTHLGLEYPLFLNTLLLRAGVASGPNLALTSLGAELDFRLLKLAVTSVSDSKNSGYTRAYADITIGF